MASYVVMEPARGAGKGEAENTVFIRDGFALTAFFLPVLWLLWHRLWIEAALALAATVGLAALGNVTGFAATAPALSLLVSFYAGLEGAALRIAALRRRGWREMGIIEAERGFDAETRYFVEASSGLEINAEPQAAAPVQGRMRKAAPGPALGLLLNPGKA